MTSLPVSASPAIPPGPLRACAVALALAVASTASAQTATFQFTGGLQTWQVPANVTSVHVIADGGQGGASFAGTGGAGGRIEATVPVMPGSQLVILVGGAGEDAGWPVTGGGGGGGSYVAVGSDYSAFADPLVVAGGGAGAHSSNSNPPYDGGLGGVQLGGSGLGGVANTAAGGGGIVGNGQNGSGGGGRAAVNGGAGGNAPSSYPAGDGGYGGGAGVSGTKGGGGGGYTGGDGALLLQSSAGGHSFAHPAALDVVATAGGNPNANGSVQLSWGFEVTFLPTGGLQTYTIPADVTAVTMTARGAAGGHYYYLSSVQHTGRRGARTTATFAVTAGESLVILVGERGQNAYGVVGGGGGGGTFVARGTDFADFADPLLVAGGGAGAMGYSSTHGGATVGGSGAGGGSISGAGGGAGILGDGVNGTWASGGTAIIAGGQGGHSINGQTSTAGGFGGGGGGGWISSARGGAGGGYTGGDASANSSYGGSSFVHATGWDAANTPGGNAGGAPGKLVITLHYGMATARRTPGSLGCGPTPMTIRAVGGARPQLGTSFVSEVAQVPATAVLTSVGMGLSQTSTGGVPLPFDLGLIGAPACTLYNDLALGAVFATTPSGGNAFRHTFAIPTDVILAGMPVYQQGWSLVPGANPLQILTSDQLELVLGY